MQGRQNDRRHAIPLERKAYHHPGQQHLRPQECFSIPCYLLTRNKPLEYKNQEKVSHPSQEHNVGVRVQHVRIDEPVERVHNMPTKEEAEASRQGEKDQGYPIQTSYGGHRSGETKA